METSLKTGFAQVFSCCPKNLSCPNFGGAAAKRGHAPSRLPVNCYSKEKSKGICTEGYLEKYQFLLLLSVQKLIPQPRRRSLGFHRVSLLLWCTCYNGNILLGPIKWAALARFTETTFGSVSIHSNSSKVIGTSSDISSNVRTSRRKYSEVAGTFHEFRSW